MFMLENESQIGIFFKMQHRLHKITNHIFTGFFSKFMSKKETLKVLEVFERKRNTIQYNTIHNTIRSFVLHTGLQIVRLRLIALWLRKAAA